jgi:hypothetical protein
VQLVDISGGMRFTYAGDLSDSEPQPTVTLNYAHNGVVYTNTVTFAPRFSILAPTGPLTVTRTGSGFAVQLGAPDPNKLLASMEGNCVRVDGTFTDMDAAVPYRYVGVVAGGTAYQINATDLDTSLNAVSKQAGPNGTDLSPVQTCDLHIAWTVRNNGQTSAGLSKHSTFVADTSVTHEIFYNGQH